MKSQKKGYVFALVWLVVLLISAGCTDSTTGQQGGGGADGKQAGESGEDRMQLDIMAMSFYPESAPSDSPVVEALEDYTNVDMTIQWVPNSSYWDKFNITLASGNLPEIMVASKKPSFVNAVEDGAFWELGPYLNDYENLSQAHEIILNNSSINGKVYGIYRARALGRLGITYRKDWLENVGMEPPETIDDFYRMLKAFKTQDPDGNGKDDTYGLSVCKYAGPWDIMQTWFGVPNKWGIDENGQLYPYFESEHYLEALNFFKRLYDEGLVNEDFAVMDCAKWTAEIVNGEGGVMVDVLDAAHRIQEDIDEAYPEQGRVIDVIKAVEGPEGLRNLPTAGYSNMLAIPKTSVETEAELKNVLAFLDKLNDEQAQILLGNGIEGRHYEKKDGYMIPTDDPNLLKEVNDLNQLLMFIPEDRTIPREQTDLRKKEQRLMKENEEIVVGNPAASLVSEVYAQKGPQLDKIMEDARIQYIVGDMDEAGLREAIDLWWQTGGDELVKEMNRLYEQVER